MNVHILLFIPLCMLSGIGVLHIATITNIVGAIVGG